ncbi:MAG: PDR/VanB family oxidoreductase [Hyphomicrobiaceae bacterium]
MAQLLVIKSIKVVTERVRMLTLAAANGGELPGYCAGAHLDFDIEGIGTRSYSLVDFEAPGNAPESYRIAVQREDDGDGGSVAMHQLAVGDQITASLPKNDFALNDDGRPALLLAGGIGVTPIISFAAELTHRGAQFAFHYATRSESVCTFKERLTDAFQSNLSLWFDDADPIDLKTLVSGTNPETHIFCCGPKGMIEAVRELGEAAGFPKEQIHFELFASPASHAGDQPFEIEISSTGQVFSIPADKTIVEVLEAEGVDVMYDCQRGDCGICQTNIVSGEPDHRDVVLSESERASGKVMQICVSRAKSPRLVLDI